MRRRFHFAAALSLKNLTGAAGIDREVKGVYACDLLSLVMAKSSKGDAWITVHTHLNIVAVAVLSELSCIIVPEDIKVEETTLRKAREEGIPILSTSMNSYEICWKAHEILKNQKAVRP